MERGLQPLKVVNVKKQNWSTKTNEPHIYDSGAEFDKKPNHGVG